MLNYVYLFLLGAAVLIGMLVNHRKIHRAYILFTIFLLVTLLNEIACYYLRQAGKYTIIPYNIYYYFRFVFLGVIFQTLLPPGHFAIKYLIRPFYGLSLVLAIFLYIKMDGIDKELHTPYLVAGGIFVIANCLIIFYESLKRTDTDAAGVQPFLICSIALFIYFLGILPFFGVINLLIKSYTSLAVYASLIAQMISIFAYSIITLDYYRQWKRSY